LDERSHSVYAHYYNYLQIMKLIPRNNSKTCANNDYIKEGSTLSDRVFLRLNYCWVAGCYNNDSLNIINESSVLLRRPSYMKTLHYIPYSKGTHNKSPIRRGKYLLRDKMSSHASGVVHFLNIIIAGGI